MCWQSWKIVANVSPIHVLPVLSLREHLWLHEMKRWHYTVDYINLVAVCCLLFADDSAPVAHTASDMQLLVDRFSMATSQFTLKINIKKTECMYQPVKFICPPPEPIDITIDEVPLVKTTDFTYLGRTVSSSSKIDKELRTRTGKASAAFGKLQQRLWNNKHVSIRVKCKVYRAVVLSTLLYGAETWTIYRAQVKKLHAVMMRQLRTSWASNGTIRSQMLKSLGVQTFHPWRTFSLKRT